MKWFALKVLSMPAIVIVTLIACGYVLPYGQRITVVNAETVKIVRGDGFYTTLTYEMDRSSGNEMLVIAGPTRFARVEYSGACKCVMDYHRDRIGRDEDSIFVSKRLEKDGKDFVVADAVANDGPLKGKHVKLGFYSPIDDLKPYFDEAQALLDGTRTRFADVIPKK